MLSSLLLQLSTMYAKIKYSELISYDLIETSLILFYVPLLNHIILPCFPGVSMKGRIGVGIFFFFLSTSLGTVVTSQLTSIHSPHMKIFWETMPIVLFAFGETLVFVSGELPSCSTLSAPPPYLYSLRL